MTVKKHSVPGNTSRKQTQTLRSNDRKFLQPQSAEESPRVGLEAPAPCLALLCPARVHPTLKPTLQLLLRERSRSQNLLRDITITSPSRKEPSGSAACTSKTGSVWRASPGNKGGEELDSFVFVAFTVQEAIAKCAQHVPSTPVYVGHSHMTYIITLPFKLGVLYHTQAQCSQDSSILQLKVYLCKT